MRYATFIRLWCNNAVNMRGNWNIFYLLSYALLTLNISQCKIFAWEQINYTSHMTLIPITYIIRRGLGKPVLIHSFTGSFSDCTYKVGNIYLIQKLKHLKHLSPLESYCTFNVQNMALHICDKKVTYELSWYIRQCGLTNSYMLIPPPPTPSPQNTHTHTHTHTHTQQQQSKQNTHKTHNRYRWYRWCSRNSMTLYLKAIKYL